MPLEHVLEVRGEGVVDVEEVRHVGDVVHDLAAVGVLHQDRVPGPVAPLVTVGGVDVRDVHAVGGWVPLGVVPDEQLAVPLQRAPGLGSGAQGHPLGVRNGLALAVAAPTPVVERAGDLVTLDRALCQVTTHVPAVRVEDVQLAVVLALEHHEFGPERVDRVRLAVLVVPRQSEAVPATGETCRWRAGVDRAGGCCLCHAAPPGACAAVAVVLWSCGADTVSVSSAMWCAARYPTTVAGAMVAPVSAYVWHMAPSLEFAAAYCPSM